MPIEQILGAAERAFLAGCRRAVLATVGEGGKPRLVPVCYVVGEAGDKLGRPRIYSPIDEKSKTSTDPHNLARVRDLLILPTATLLVDRWDEDWSKLAWLRLYGTAELLEPQPHEVEEHATAVAGLRAKYEQYAGQRLEDRPIIRITVTRAVSWGALG